jgi:hypothetical protein
MSKLPWAIGLAASVSCLSSPAFSYNVESAFGPGCHEILTGRAFQDFLVEVPTVGLELPGDQTWQKIARSVLDATRTDWSRLDEEQRFMLASLVIGVREPDTDGHSIMNLNVLRELHADPNPAGQYMHCLRGKDDDYEAGNGSAVAGTRKAVLDLMETSAYYWSLPPRKQIIKGKFFVDFYDRVEVDVWAPMYYLGMAAHVLQDSFAHTLRADQDDLRTIVHVTNYIDAISDDFNEERDGLAHSVSMGQCENPNQKDLADATVGSTIDLFYAARSMYNGTDPVATSLVFDAWLTYKPGCNLGNDFCDNRRWLDELRKDQTSPYLACSVARQAGRPRGLWLWSATLALLVVRMRRRKGGRA